MVESTPVVWLDGKESAGQPFLRLSAIDNVAVALRTLKPGEELSLPAATPDQEATTVVVAARIMKGHKVALSDLNKGARVVKYAQLIGVAAEDIKSGEHVHSHNLSFINNDTAYARNAELKPETIESSDTFQGYKRADGRVGTRNYIAVISSVNCSATVANRISEAFNHGKLDDYANVDGVVAFTHGTGCGMDSAGEGFQNLQRVLAGYARHPNVGGVLLVGLGCENSQIAGTIESHKLATGPLLRVMNIQTTGGHVKTIARGVEIIESMLDEVGSIQRETCPASALTVALQCGGSDAWSGITANPALGYASDLLVRQGGTAVLAETPEIYGAEHLLTQRAASDEVAAELMNRISWWQDYVARNNGSLDNNPSPGNKLGGLTTILEKSLGAVAKGGTTMLNGVFRYAEQVDKPGFVFMDSPGYDPASVTGQIASGCNLVVFTTGRGSTFGSKPAPCMKVATNTDMYRQLSDDMDINAGTIVSDGDSVAEVGERIYRRLLEVASGSVTLSEGHGLGDHEFVPWQIGATM
ncbi:UxaA family hydrolase [Granulosicoccus antarcticus]|uniref:Altronate dehydratase n=1 Tax=Granulosicoccus antarcticus IMCC3135 TaxID=1192854 RepID=A0A2Z2NNI6_9GAMM|nr:altronate dehydratase family protein [Granulosicoccus antarcticus]ASJ72976.1 Altronate dehydratase [Granulosicoccus antarcticus IMCC3135]